MILKGGIFVDNNNDNIIISCNKLTELDLFWIHIENEKMWIPSQNVDSIPISSDVFILGDR